MMEEIVALLNQIKNATTLTCVFLFFVFILFLGFYFGSLIDEYQKRKKAEREEEKLSLKEEIVKDITNYYDNTKGEN